MQLLLDVGGAILFFIVAPVVLFMLFGFDKMFTERLPQHDRRRQRNEPDQPVHHMTIYVTDREDTK